jgi:hypothetical protein
MHVDHPSPRPRRFPRFVQTLDIDGSSAVFRVHFLKTSV